MKNKISAWIKGRKRELIFTGIMFVLMSLWALFQIFDGAPDENMRYQIPEYIFKYHKLPDGRDELLRNSQWGISYGFGPQLCYLCQAFFMWLIHFIVSRPAALIFAARMVSVCSATATLWVSILISEKILDKVYRPLFVALIGFLPQFLYLGCYINNDSMALFGTSLIVYMWICGMEYGWKYRHCIGLALGIVVCTLTYFNSYGFILCSILFLFGSLILQKKQPKEIMKKSFLIAGIVILLTSWYFIRNYLLYDGDFLGMRISTEYAEMYAIDRLKPSMRETPYNTGQSLAEMFFGESGWFAVSWRSFVGVFGYMAVYMKQWQYYFYCFLFWTAVIGIFFRKKKKAADSQKRLFTAVMAAAAVIPFVLSLYNSYYNDYQPQGRYMMPMLIPLMYFVTRGIQNVMEHFMKPEKIQGMVRMLTVVIAGIMVYVYIVCWFYTYRDMLNLVT